MQCGIENIDRQFHYRPIPNFYSLLNESVTIDEFLCEGDVISCEAGISLEVLDAPGQQSIQLALDNLAKIEAAVRQAIQLHPGASPDIQFPEVCRLLHLEKLEKLVLFRKTISVYLNEVKSMS